MRTLGAFIGNLVLLGCVCTRALSQFEGVVESENLTTDEMGAVHGFVMTMWIKKDMVRIETSASDNLPGSTMIYRADKQLVWMLNVDDRSYFEIRQDEQAEQYHLPGTSAEKYSLKRTGRTRTILGYPCEQVIIKREGEETEIWGTKKLSHLMTTIAKALGDDHAESPDSWANDLQRMGIYPLTSSTRLDGKVVESQEAKRIETKSLPQTMFEIPSGYRKQTVSDMLQGVEKKN